MRLAVASVVLLAAAAFGQGSAGGQTLPPVALTHDPSLEFNLYQPSDTPTSSDGNDIRIGHDDLLEVSVFEVPELSSVARVTAAGTVVLPYVGPIEATHKTPQELADTIETALRTKYVNDPHVTVFIREYASQPVSVIGAVKMPGIYQIKGQKLLLDVLAMAQGLSENAGKTIQVIRKAVTTNGVGSTAEALPTTVQTKTVDAKTIVIDAADLFQNGNAALNIPLFAGDVINVLNAGSIFTVGEFQHPGESLLRFGRPVTVTQAVALGGGLTKEAKKGQAFLIRPHADGTKEQIAVNIGKILDGSQPDVPMNPNDVLFVPANKIRTGLNKTLDSVIAIVIGRTIYQGW